MLRHAVILAIHHPLFCVLSEVEALFDENRQEIMEDLIALDFRDVLDADDIWLRLSY